MGSSERPAALLEIRLIAEDREMLAVLRSAKSFSGLYDAEISHNLEAARALVRQALDFQTRVCAHRPWINYLTVEMESKLVVGCCGFKGNPTADHSVEIAYHTFPEFERRGFASRMAVQLIDIARKSGGARQVIAHTLPERNASTRILQKTGFQRLGEVEDPDDGRVWQWRLKLVPL